MGRYCEFCRKDVPSEHISGSRFSPCYDNAAQRDYVRARNAGKTVVIQYSPSLVVRNLESLPHGTGAKFLEVIQGESGEYVAKSWHRKMPKYPCTVIKF